MYRIGVVTGTRAEYGLLKPMMERIQEDDMLELYLIVTGAHLEDRLGCTVKEIEKDGFTIGRKIQMDLSSDTSEGICLSVSREMQGLAGAYRDAGIDLLILLGDRYETLAAAIAATIFNIPIAHIHGGEVTEGAIDDAMRHAITKMSHLHFASTAEYARRIVQMGEQPEHVHVVGALGVENIKNMHFLGRQELAEHFSGLFLEPYMMVTYHPVTLDDEPVQKQAGALLEALLDYPEYNYVFTYANADRDGTAINEMLDAFVSKNKNAAVFRSMGQTGYLSALCHACAVVGNSSSGIIEAPSFHIPTVNIGDRQKGRIAGVSVIHCKTGYAEIHAAIGQALTKEFRRKCLVSGNPYEGVDTCGRITSKIKRELEKGICLQKKFYDYGVSE
ncbi:UDP-N-acetylglucosamine 2-epimerase [Lachnospiraceae bacterium 47-T17]